MKVYSASSIEDLLSQIGEDVKGSNNFLTGEQLENLNAASALDMAKVSCAGADNLIVALAGLTRGDMSDGRLDAGATLAELLHDQSDAWLKIYDRLLTTELRAEADAQMAGYRAKLSGDNPFGDAKPEEDAKAKPEQDATGPVPSDEYVDVDPRDHGGF
jgi:hypothetical protein